MKIPFAAALITAYVWLVFFITLLPFFIIFLVVWAITIPFDRKLKACHYFVGLWAGFYICINPWWKVTIRNRYRFEKDRTYIILSNHQSVLDVLAIYQLYFPFRWVIKQELFSLPLLGWVLRLNRHIPVIRGDKESKDKMITQALRSLRDGISVLIFPEGTRSNDGNLGAFRDGAFHVALESKAVILPVIIDGAYHALPKDGFLFRGKKHIVVKVLHPLKPSDYEPLPMHQLIHNMEDLMNRELLKLRNENILLSHE